MSRFLSGKHSGLIPYTPGEQPKKQKFIKLNTNESPFPPSDKAIKAASCAATGLNLYSDPECSAFLDKLSEITGLNKEKLIATNGSDEILNFIFAAFCDEEHPAVFPDITYGFYKVFAALNGVPYEEIPLKDDFTVDIEDYCGIGKNIFLANPNAPTGIYIPLSDIERILKTNPDNIVVIDEAYIDFGSESAISLLDKYKNLIVTQTFSKSRSMAGARLGFGAANEEIIKDLNTIRFSTNPYNVNSMTLAAGIGSLSDNEYTVSNCREIIRVREYTKTQLKNLGFIFPDSKTNFIFASRPGIEGKLLYSKLREKGILVRHFDTERLTAYLRITVGTEEQMNALINALKTIMEEIL